MLNVSYHPNGSLIYEGYNLFYNSGADVQCGNRLCLGTGGHSCKTFIVVRVGPGSTKDKYSAQAFEIGSPIYKEWKESGFIP